MIRFAGFRGPAQITMKECIFWLNVEPRAFNSSIMHRVGIPQLSFLFFASA